MDGDPFPYGGDHREEEGVSHTKIEAEAYEVVRSLKEAAMNQGDRDLTEVAIRDLANFALAIMEACRAEAVKLIDTQDRKA